MKALSFNFKCPEYYDIPVDDALCNERRILSVRKIRPIERTLTLAKKLIIEMNGNIMATRNIPREKVSYVTCELSRHFSVSVFAFRF